ncbi:periplasmic chaperone for outer membrane proteins Skp [Neolewinella xylanilytica]|uniref:Periplasmic chaperone for outer membrane proteins Skp n=1 Tax=Neolewinella xylanilytica TaxID=1514080 RepID=A0A2S6I373_9BACT|nr:OmpH family outer membrane protein [Neolewinella xylanilytica]PPK85615.1 periplasmic chaperone for outer membrane proteins Skp [Neolewinella xylanilytica]
MTDFARILPLSALVLLCFTFFGCEGTTGETAPASQAAEAPARATSGLDIVFVKVDSLQAGYTAVATELQRLEANFLKAQQSHAGRVQALETEVKGLQNQMQQGLLAPNKVQAEQQRIARKEQEIMQQRDLALNSIQEDQMRIQQNFSERVQAVLEELQEENGYDFILNQGQNSAVLVTNDAYDITNLVLERLNAASDTIQ